MKLFRHLLPAALAALCSLPVATRALPTNSLVWQTAPDQVSADLHRQPLWPVLEAVAHQTGWHIFVEPDTARVIDVKFQNEPRKEA